MTKRLSTGVPGLDEKLGGGLLAGATAVIVGSSGAGKTQLSLQFLNAGLTTDERRRGVVLDLTARGDSQNHAGYAKSLFDWTLREQDADVPFDPENFSPRFKRASRIAAITFRRFRGPVGASRGAT